MLIIIVSLLLLVVLTVAIRNKMNLSENSGFHKHTQEVTRTSQYDLVPVDNYRNRGSLAGGPCYAIFHNNAYSIRIMDRNGNTRDVQLDSAMTTIHPSVASPTYEVTETVAYHIKESDSGESYRVYDSQVRHFVLYLPEDCIRYL